jgi:NADH:ubiquinone oxidoreductase subunit H
MIQQAASILDTVPWWLIALVKSLVILFVVLTVFAYSMLFERKIMAWMQLRPGPNRVGPWGLMQPAADAAKMLFKEDLTPSTADPLIYKLAPFISLVCAMGAFAVIPFSESSAGLWGVGDVNARSRRSASTAYRLRAGRRVRSFRFSAACVRPRR